MKLIKINTDHYVIVDDSEIKEKSGDWFYSFETGIIYHTLIHHTAVSCKKITHSTQKLYKNDFWAIQELKLSEVKELIGEVDVEKDYVLSRLCVHNKRNPDYIPYDEDDESIKPKDCGCDNCFYGRTILSEKILQLNQAIEDNKEKKYTEEDLRKAIGMARDIKDNSAHDIFTVEDISGCTEICTYGWRNRYKDEEIIQSLRPKTEWEVEFVDGKLKLK